MKQLLSYTMTVKIGTQQKRGQHCILLDIITYIFYKVVLKLGFMQVNLFLQKFQHLHQPITKLALQNAINHAKTKDIYVKVEMVSTQVNIIIKDGGVGFDTNEINSNSNSFGLVGMKERVDLLKGEISIESEINQGTTVKIKVPLDPT